MTFSGIMSSNKYTLSRYINNENQSHIVCIWSAYGICFERRLPYIESLIMNVSVFFIRFLEQEGVEFIFGIPGEENLDFLESLN